jgi:hypothetical protein
MATMARFYDGETALVHDVSVRTTAFKYNCNLVLIDFFVRHGLLSADDPQFMAIVSGLKKEYTSLNGIG